MAPQEIPSDTGVEVDVKEDFNKETQEHEHAVGAAADGHHFDDTLKSKWEDLSRVKTLKLFWKMALVCFAVAFSAAADGYQVTLAGNLIANKGFIKQFATEVDSDGEPIIAAGVFAVWGPLGSVGQWTGMNTAPFIADRFGRKVVLIWIATVLAVSIGIECAARHWGVWAVAKVVGLIGIGSMQSMMQVYLSEMSPTSAVRGTMLACYNLWYMINVNQWNWGLRSAFFFAGLSALPIISCWFVLPETKGRSPAELDELFEKKVRPWRMRAFVTEVEQRRGLQEAQGV